MDPFCPSSPGGRPLSIGDCIYLLPADAELDPYIARIEDFRRDCSDGKQLLYVRWFYRLADEFQHTLPTSGLGKESVFYTSYFDTQAPDHVLGHCKVVTRPEYDMLQGRNAGMDVYACEYSYSAESQRGFVPIRDEYFDLSPGSCETTALYLGAGDEAAALARSLAELQQEERRDHPSNSTDVWRNHSAQFSSAKRPGLSAGQENVDPQRNGNILELFAGKPRRITGSTDMDEVGVALLGNMDLIARHACAVSEAERMQREELEGEITWGTRRRSRLRENSSSRPECVVTGLQIASNNNSELQEAASNSRKPRKPARPDKATKSLVQKTRPDCSLLTVTGPSSSLATNVSAVTKDPIASKTHTRTTPGMLKLPKEMQGRWSSERYKSAQLKLIDIMHQRGAVPGKPILRPALRDEARKHIGDTGLLDHLLKHMTDTVVSSGERFRRRHNPSGAMEYWLEDGALMEIRKAAGIDDPWWMPPPGWKPGDRVPARGEYVCSQGMSPTEAAEMKRLQDLVSKMRSEMKSLSVQVKDLSKKVSAAQSGNSDSAKRMDNMEIDLQKNIKDTYEKMEIEMRKICREIETRTQEESLKHQSAIQHKSNVDGGRSGPTRSSGELDQVDNTDARRLDRPDSQKQLEIFEVQFQSLSEEWQIKFDQVGADKIDIEGQLSTMCKVVDRIQDDMQSIMRALGFSEQNLKHAQDRSAGFHVPATDRSAFPATMGNPGSTDSVIEVPDKTQGAPEMLLERLQVQNLVLQLCSSNRPEEDLQFRASDDTTKKHQPGLAPRTFGRHTSNMLMTGALRMENMTSPQLLPAVVSDLQMTAQSADSNIHMLLRLPPKKYISSMFQHHVNLHGVIPKAMASDRFQTPSIYGGLLQGHGSSSQARPTLSDYQHQHQEENRQRNVRIFDETPVSYNAALPAARENVGSSDFRSDGLIGSQQEWYPGRSSPACGHNRRLQPKDSPTYPNVQACKSQNVQTGHGADTFRNEEAVTSAKRKHSSSNEVMPLAKRLASPRVEAATGTHCTEVQDNELSTRLSLSVTSVQHAGAVSKIAPVPLVSQPSSMGGLESSAHYEEAPTTGIVLSESSGMDERAFFLARSCFAAPNP